jgi:hypothetical protein
MHKSLPQNKEESCVCRKNDDISPLGIRFGVIMIDFVSAGVLSTFIVIF